jgi:MFS family permease
VERNVRLYPLYAAAARFYCAEAVFYLYVSEYLTLEELLRLEAVYYVAYTLLEVPSGYLSDRVGRRLTLLISMASSTAAYLLLSLGASFSTFAIAQVLLAVTWTFRSGTETSLHYDSLAAVGLEHEYPAREARAQRNSLASAALAAVVGGLAASFELRAAYVVTLVGTLVPLGLVLAMREPQHAPDAAPPPDFAHQLRICVGYALRPSLAWLVGVFVAMYVLSHAAYMFYQPYLAALSGDLERAPLLTGVHLGIAMLLGSWGAGASIRLRDRLGVPAALLVGIAVQTLLVALMAGLLHPAIAVLILLRSTSPAIVNVVLNAEITPQIPRAQRATYLSMQSLVGRLLFAVLLLGLSLLAGERSATDPAVVATMLGASAVFGVTALAVLLPAASAWRRAAD